MYLKISRDTIRVFKTRKNSPKNTYLLKTRKMFKLTFPTSRQAFPCLVIFTKIRFNMSDIIGMFVVLQSVITYCSTGVLWNSILTSLKSKFWYCNNTIPPWKITCWRLTCVVFSTLFWTPLSQFSHVFHRAFSKVSCARVFSVWII